jgi:hypothetical protein
MGPDSYTELFFLDEATSFAAGHRPCYECRRQDAISFAELWAEQHVTGSNVGVVRAKAGDIDTVLHAERLTPRNLKATFASPVGNLPTGAFVRWRDGAYLVLAGRLLRWAPEGYTAAVDIAPDTVVQVLTPKSTLAVFQAGYDADVHESALDFM